MLEFDGDPATSGVEDAVARIEARIQEKVPAARDIFIEVGAFRGDRGAQDAKP